MEYISLFCIYNPLYTLFYIMAYCDDFVRTLEQPDTPPPFIQLGEEPVILLIRHVKEDIVTEILTYPFRNHSGIGLSESQRDIYLMESAGQKNPQEPRHGGESLIAIMRDIDQSDTLVKEIPWQTIFSIRAYNGDLFILKGQNIADIHRVSGYPSEIFKKIYIGKANRMRHGLLSDGLNTKEKALGLLPRAFSIYLSLKN